MDVSKKLEKNIAIAEGNLIGVLYKCPDLFSEISISKDELSSDGLFYYTIGEKLYESKHDVFNEVAIYSLLEGNDSLKESWERYGGWQTISSLTQGVSVKNYEAYVDSFSKYCLLRNLNEKGFNISKDYDKFSMMNASQVYDWWDYQLNSITIDTVSDIDFESLSLSDEELMELDAGEEMGLNYGKHSKFLNSLTMGIPKSEMTLIAGYVNSGKSSFTVANIVIPIAENKIKTAIISNEQKSKVFKLLLMVYVLTNDLDYWNLTRKKLKAGNYTDQDKTMIEKARQIIKEKYDPYITFVKLFDYNSSMVKKIIKKLSKRGLELVMYDTFKAGDLGDRDGAGWEKLIQDSKDLFQIASKENLGFVATCQLALNQMGKRFLDLNTMSGARGISEVASEVIQFRDIFSDEFSGQKYDIKPYKLIRDKHTGKFTNVKEEITLDPNKKYKLFFLSKTRNDEQNKVVVYEVVGAFNIWKEIGFATVVQTGY